MRNSQGWIGASLVGLTLVAAACSSGSSSPTTTTKPAPSIASGSKYVALGSSYAAGIGIPTQSGGACARSSNNYPSLVAAKLKLSLDDATCSGATTANILTTPEGTEPLQIDAVTQDTKLVTFTVGGNDIGLTVTAISCGSQTSGCASDPAQLTANLATLRTSLTTLVSTIRAKAPSATIVMVTYPRLVFPTSCPALNFTSQGEQIVGTMGAGLEKDFVQVAKTTHILIADPYVLGAGHGPCASSDESWIAGHSVTVGFPYHPTPLGHQEMAKLTEQALQN